MSESLLYDLQRQLGMLAYRDVTVTSDGRYLRGTVNPVIAEVQHQLLAHLYALQDGTCCRPLAEHIVATAQEIVACHRDTIRQLRRQVEA
jgi:hypothetical protein